MLKTILILLVAALFVRTELVFEDIYEQISNPNALLGNWKVVSYQRQQVSKNIYLHFTNQSYNLVSSCSVLSAGYAIDFQNVDNPWDGHSLRALYSEPCRDNMDQNVATNLDIQATRFALKGKNIVFFDIRNLQILQIQRVLRLSFPKHDLTLAGSFRISILKGIQLSEPISLTFKQQQNQFILQGCNIFNGFYKKSNNNWSFKVSSSGRRQCEQSSDNKVIAALRQTQYIRLLQGDITLLNRSNKPLMTLNTIDYPDLNQNQFWGHDSYEEEQFNEGFYYDTQTSSTNDSA